MTGYRSNTLDVQSGAHIGMVVAVLAQASKVAACYTRGRPGHRPPCDTCSRDCYTCRRLARSHLTPRPDAARSDDCEAATLRQYIMALHTHRAAPALAGRRHQRTRSRHLVQLLDRQVEHQARVLLLGTVGHFVACCLVRFSKLNASDECREFYQGHVLTAQRRTWQIGRLVAKF